MSSKGTDFWIKKLTKHSMPVVGQTIAELNSLTGDKDADVSQLSEVILRDPNLTSHVLRIANSVYYNYSNSPVNTVSRAIVIIGLKGMRAVCISLLLIDSLLSKGPKERLLQLMAQGVHAATQARDLIKIHDPEVAEEVFVAGLLFNLGEMAFLANEKMTDKNQDLFSSDTKTRREAMESVLGTSFKSLSLGLAKFWKLGDTLTESLSTTGTPSNKAQAVVLGEQISRAALTGWDSKAMTKTLDRVSQFTGYDLDQCYDQVKESAVAATEVAMQYGAPEVCQLIPSQNHKAKLEKSKKVVKKGKILRGDASLQLNILRELSTASAEKAEVNTIMQMIIEGMHRGIGLERVGLAFILHHRAKAKFVLGESTETWRSAFDFDVGPYTDNLFTHSITAGGAVYMDKSFLAEHSDLVSSDIKRVLGPTPCFIYVLEVGGRNPALFYADRADFGGKLSRDQFESFRHFALQAQAYLTTVSEKVKKH